MLPGKRIIATGSGLLATMALFGCAQTAGARRPTGSVVPANADVATSAPAAPAAPAQAAPAGIAFTTLVAASIPKMGQVVTDEKGWVLYRFDKDSANPPTATCEGKCAEIWPPMLDETTPNLQGIAPDKVGMVRRADGGMQVTLAGWPLYRYVGDAKAGQWKGQGVNGTWFVVAPDGTKNLTCVPSGTPTPATPPPSSPAASPAAGAGGGYGGQYQY